MKLKQKIILEHRDANQLAALGKAILTQWQNEIAENVHYDPGSSGNPDNLLPERIPSLQLLCPNDLSGEILMLCIRLPGIKIDLKPLDI